jgi:hypothetical protein
MMVATTSRLRSETAIGEYPTRCAVVSMFEMREVDAHACFTRGQLMTVLEFSLCG